MNLSTIQRVVLAAVTLIAFGSLAISVIFVLDDQADDNAKHQESVDTSFVGCLRFNDTRLLLRQIILDAYGTETNQAFDITSLREFQSIDDPDVKDLLVLLTSGQSGSDSTARRDRSYNRTGTRDCEAEFPDHSEGLSLDPGSLVPPPPLQ